MGATKSSKRISHAIHRLGTQSGATQFAVACSAGVDSAMLAVYAARWAQQHGHSLHLFHIHHGLQSRAEGWVQQVQRLAQLLQVPCHILRVHVDLHQGDGMESAARRARYHAFEQLCEFTGVRHVLLGHHQDDQAETVLLRLLRGAGPTGMAAMAEHSQRQGIHYLRPLLTIPRAALMTAASAFTQQTGWEPVWDPTNTQDDYTRGALRDRLVPHLNARWSGWQRVVSRHAAQSQETTEILAEVAAADLTNIDYNQDGDRSFCLALWRELRPARQTLVLRYWLGLHNLAMPTQARLDDMLRQMRQLHALGFDRHMQIKHDGMVVNAHRGRVFLSIFN